MQGGTDGAGDAPARVATDAIERPRGPGSVSREFDASAHAAKLQKGLRGIRHRLTTIEFSDAHYSTACRSHLDIMLLHLHKRKILILGRRHMKQCAYGPHIQFDLFEKQRS